MNKIKQNKITFSLILIAIFIIFSSLTILSLPVLFNYKSKVDQIEKNFYANFKIFLASYGNISYKPFPKPHLLVEKAELNFKEIGFDKSQINTENLKIFISLRDIYLRTFKDFLSTEISKTNLELQMSDIKDIRNHMYKKINKPIILEDCKVFVKNKSEEVIIIAPIKRVTYKINNKLKNKVFYLNGKIFGINFKSNWVRSYKTPNMSKHEFQLVNPNIIIKNNLKLEQLGKFRGETLIETSNDKLNYKYTFNNHKIFIKSPDSKKFNFKLNSDINLSPFYFDGKLLISNKKVESLIDNILLKLLNYNESYIGNINGKLKLKFDSIQNKIIDKGEIDLKINEKKITLDKVNFKLRKIGEVISKVNYFENQGDLIFKSQNVISIKNYIEFAKTFQVSSKKVKNLDNISFNIEKKFGDSEFLISNIKLNRTNGTKKINEKFLITNIQNLRASIRKVVN